MMRLKPSGIKRTSSWVFNERKHRVARQISLGEIIEGFGGKKKFEQVKYRKQNKSLQQ